MEIHGDTKKYRFIFGGYFMRDIEDGMGFSGLIETKEERYINKLEKENKNLKVKINLLEDWIREACNHIGIAENILQQDYPKK